MMNQQDILKKIGLILNELQDQYEFLALNPAQLNELELELFLANTNFLSDHVQVVRKMNSNPPVKQIPEHALVAELDSEIPTAVSEATDHEPVVLDPIAESEHHELFKPESEPQNHAQHEPFNLTQEAAKFEFILDDESLSDKFDFEEKSVNDIFDRPLSEEETRIIAEKQREVSAELFEEPIADLDPEEKPELLPVEETPRLTLNDLLAGKATNHSNVNDGSFKAPITDLRQAINLNEKLLYIKDLFNGYNLAYAEAIDLINKMPDFQTADNFLKNNYAIKNNWASKQTTVDQFYELLNQRFTIK